MSPSQVDRLTRAMSNSMTSLGLSSRAAAERMTNDADIQQEAKGPPATLLSADTFLVYGGAYRPTDASAALVRKVGLEKLTDFTSRFYAKAFKDKVLDKFLREHDAHHAQRFGSWIFEKLGGGDVWTQERRTRPQCPFHAHGHTIQSAHDRSSAHFAAWHSPKRDAKDWGDHFKLDDCRVWMRLHFWAAREAGIFEEHAEFAELYVRLIGHFVSVYESKAPSFARESARWSENPKNTEKYNKTGVMDELYGISTNEALRQLPPAERAYTGSSAHPKLWPYEAC